MCDTVVVVEDQRVLFAKNSDRDPNEAQLLEWQTAREHVEGAEVRCTWLTIPQVRRTHAVLLSRPFWMWGAEMGANEHGVVVGNEAVFTRAPLAASGLTGMDLLRLALERAGTAEEAVGVIQGLLAAHGQGGGCGHEDRGFTYHNSFLVADPGGAFVLETAGREVAVEVVTGGVRSISNGLTIADFAARHADPVRTAVSRCRVRRARSEHLARSAWGVADLMWLLRDHGEGRRSPAYSAASGGMGAACMHAGGLLANAQTTASWVAELSPGGVSHWVTGTAAPCTGLFKPVRVGEPLDLGTAPTDCADARSLWWRHERLHREVMRDPARLLPLYTAERDAVEARWVLEPPAPAEAFSEAETLLGRWEQRVAAAGYGAAPRDVRPAWVKRYWEKRNTWAGVRSSPTARGPGPGYAPDP
ncbi:carcinine hydrolase/isopenicillin-N N-acyltransferase family protein [Chondromyces apiculatus]|uniref:Peptidase C45 hydrolase domain-containing protein n=1 Tax=Chondromyces apiculatus DSM 436 TaxID=1192034 RepID=A0A017T333_9BACT|nr:carcinine hydrolase/isopenicillin-N N-acyltransferase family protein [Chondromyces apiculatus]EYF03260.1 Hypothetical protein CAP_5764 [Chondromyces apiculatus DSM 436]